MLTPPPFASRDQRMLFVGGVADGQWLSVPQDCDRYEVPWGVSVSGTVSHMDTDSAHWRIPYRREHVRSPSGSLTFFAAAHLSGLAALEMLLRGYRPGAQEEHRC